jgi:hypothetical protein
MEQITTELNETQQHLKEQQEMTGLLFCFCLVYLFSIS